MELRRNVVKVIAEIFSIPEKGLSIETNKALLEAAKILAKRLETEWNQVLLRLKNGEPIIIDFYKEDYKGGEGIEVVVKESVSQSHREATDRLTEKPPTPKAKGSSPKTNEILAAIPPELCKRLGEVPTPGLLNKIRIALNGAPTELLTQRIRQRWATIKSLGMIENLAGDVAKVNSRQPQASISSTCHGKTSSNPREHIRTTLDLLYGLPGHVQAVEWRAEIERWRTKDGALVAELEREVCR